jgi:hypothetical protein
VLDSRIVSLAGFYCYKDDMRKWACYLLTGEPLRFLTFNKSAVEDTFLTEGVETLAAGTLVATAHPAQPRSEFALQDQQWSMFRFCCKSIKHKLAENQNNNKNNP